MEGETQKNLQPNKNELSLADEKFLRNVFRIIHERMDDGTFSIGTFSVEAGYSTTQFYRLIKRLTGQSPNAFLRTARLNHASSLLKLKTWNVSQVAYAVGFSSLSYFNKSFKKYFGVTPGQFSSN